MNKKMLICNTVFAILFTISVIIAYYCWNVLQPFPERMFINQMDDEMIKTGQARNLILIVVFTALSVLFFVCNIIFSSLVWYRYVVVNGWFEYGSILMNKSYNNNNWSKILKNFLLIIFFTIYCFATILFVWCFWVGIYKIKHNKKILFNTEIVGKFRMSRLRHRHWLFFILFWPWIFLLTASFIQKSFEDSWLNKISIKDLSKSMTLSNTKNNVIFLYFDRGQGAVWNTLLYIDKLLNRENSFIEMFPEFTSWTNTFSLGNITCISNPSIYSGVPFYSLNKDLSGGVNPFSKINNKNMDQNDWYYYSIKNMVQMYQKEDIQNVNLNNLPYYNDRKYATWCGNMFQLKQDLAKENIKVNTVTNELIAKKLLNKKDVSSSNKNIYDVYIWESIDKLIKFKNTESGVFFSDFSQQIHDTYVIKNGDNVIHSTDPDDYTKAVWLVIEELKLFFSLLKNEPFIDEKTNAPMLDKKGNPISVYDKSLIFILSDHGTGLKVVPSFKTSLEFLEQNKVINKKDIDNVWNYDLNIFNPLMTLKKFKYDKDNNLIDNQISFKYDNDKLLLLSDIQQIIQNELNKYNGVELESFFNSEKYIDFIDDDKLKKLVKGLMLSNPLDENVNSIKNNKTRTVWLPIAKTWKFDPEKRDFGFRSIYEYQHSSSSKNIFVNSDYKKIL